MYYVWHATEDNPQGVPPAKYLVDEHGKIRYLVDPGISGKLSRRDDGTEVRKYNPPQAALFALITNGILSQKLPWVLVLLGVAIAMVVELCGVSSLAFAVGVYLPLSSSAPIFVGGMVRYIVERWGKNRDRPGLGAGIGDESRLAAFHRYIAGGTIAGVLIAFLNFSDPIVNSLAVWQYRTAPVAAAASFDGQCRSLAQTELGAKASDKADRSPDRRNPRTQRIAASALCSCDEGNDAEVCPGTRRYVVPADAFLFEVAEESLGSADKASLLFDLNESQLNLPESLPPEASLNIPQTNWPALAAFGLLAVFLVLVGAAGCSRRRRSSFQIWMACPAFVPNQPRDKQHDA